MLLVRIYALIFFLISNSICFEVLNELRIFDTMIEVLYAIDIILNFFHAYKPANSYQEINDISKIAWNYVKLIWLSLNIHL